MAKQNANDNISPLSAGNIDASGDAASSSSGLVAARKGGNVKGAFSAGREGDSLRRITVFFILTGVQIAVLAVLYIYFISVYRWLLPVANAVSVVLSGRVALSAKGADSKIAWIMFLLLLAPLSSAVYLLAGENGTSPLKARQLKKIYRSTAGLLPDTQLCDSLPKSVIRHCRYIEQNPLYTAWCEGEVKYLSSGEEFFDELLKKVSLARHYVFLEFFIIYEGKLSARLLELLASKSASGIEVRIICDGFGSADFLASPGAESLRSLGINLAVFEPLTAFANVFMGYRDHRKIAVIDGKYAFTGGVNLADEYINQKERFGHFKDAGVMVSGAPVQTFILMFLRMWQFTSKKRPDYDFYLNGARKCNSNIKTSKDKIYSGNGDNSDNGTCEKQKKDSCHVVVPYGDGPHEKTGLAQGVYLSVIENAQNYVYIMTPYLVIDSEMTALIRRKALSGVDVRIIIPEIPDKKPVYILTRHCAENLTEYGVKVFVYSEGFVHSKVITADGVCAAVGTVNFDYRSFYQQYECGMFFSYKSAVASAQADFEKAFKTSRLLSPSQGKKSIPRRLCTAGLMLLAPLM